MTTRQWEGNYRVLSSARKNLVKVQNYLAKSGISADQVVIETGTNDVGQTVYRIMATY